MGTFGLVHQGMGNVVIRRSWSMFIMRPRWDDGVLL
jgi:hypothetical protein